MERLTKHWGEHCVTTELNYDFLFEMSDEDFHHFQNIIKKLAQYEDEEEQGLLLRLPIAVYDVVDKLFSRNELISLWREVKEETTYHKRIWYGMAWDIPDELKQCQFVKIFGTIPESIVHADIINIEVVLSSEAEKALAEMG